MQLPEISTYKFVSETIANLALSTLTDIIEGGTDGAAPLLGVNVEAERSSAIELNYPADGEDLFLEAQRALAREDGE